MRWTTLVLLLSFLVSLLGCQEAFESGLLGEEDPGPNPFLQSSDEDGKEDSGYVNIRGVEVHVTIEADIQASSWRIFDAPADLAQYAVTYLKNHDHFYVELLAEDSSANERVEWLVEGEWLTYTQVRDLPREKLTHFRLRDVNAVVLNTDATAVRADQVYQAKVPINPYTVMTDAGDTCADPDSHIELSQSVYWYLWNPDRSNCSMNTQTMTLTVTEVLPNNPESYPEYDQLWADNRLEVVVLFGKLDDDDVADDYNWQNVTKLSEWLVEAGFTEQEDAPLGRRFVKTVGELTEVIDIYGPDLFHSVADYTRFPNWQRAVTEHEVVMYNGHSVLGTGYAFEEVVYPGHYQIFQIASCLSYEYYVRPVLAGKGSWDSVDVLSNVEPTYYSENLPLTSTILAKLLEGFENGGKTSWQDVMEAVSRRLYHSRFGVSGARGNCFSPAGDRCGGEPDPEEVTYEATPSMEIPDNNPDGVTSIIQIDDDIQIASLKVRVDITHTWVGDLVVTLTHGEQSQVLHQREGGSDDNINAILDTTVFNSTNAKGEWTLHVSDNANRDVGTLNSWTLVFSSPQ